jgi:hypothetical protein
MTKRVNRIWFEGDSSTYGINRAKFPIFRCLQLSLRSFRTSINNQNSLAFILMYTPLDIFLNENSNRAFPAYIVK